MTHSPPSIRLDREREHSALIKHRAEEIWGWASPAGVRRAQRRAGYFSRFGQIHKNDRVLEIGCGTGVFTELVAQTTGAAIIATDLSDELLELARQKQIPGCRFESADAHHLSYADASFDVVFGSSILHHLDVQKALGEIFRVLKPGGRMVFAEPNMLNPQILVQKNVPAVKKMLGDTPDETAFVRGPLKKKIRTAGFQKVTIFPYDFLHPLTPGFLIPLVENMGKALEHVPLLREIAGSLVICALK